MTQPDDPAANPEIAVQATIVLQKPQGGRVGADRIALLRAIGRSGSISAAAREIGLSYKAAWDAVQVLNNLFAKPLVVPSAGGKEGGASLISEAGEAVITAYTAAETDLIGAIARLDAGLSDGGSLAPLLWGVGMRTSARNALRGRVARVTEGVVNAEVALTVSDGVEIVATVTRESVSDLGITPGATAIALIKSSFVILARGDASLRTSARNCLPGIVVRRDDSDIASEVTLEMALGKTLTASLTRESANLLDLQIGTPALALIKASHVILAIE